MDKTDLFVRVMEWMEDRYPEVSLKDLTEDANSLTDEVYAFLELEQEVEPREAEDD